MRLPSLIKSLILKGVSADDRSIHATCVVEQALYVTCPRCYAVVIKLSDGSLDCHFRPQVYGGICGESERLPRVST